MSQLINDSNAASIITSNKITAIKFFAEWCRPCKNLAPKYEKADEAFGADNRIILVSCDIDENIELPEKYGIRSVPTILILKNGLEVGRLVGGDVNIEQTLQTFLDTL